MKNEIREAYDRMTPPPDAKERMMRNIMKKNSGGRRREYTAAPIKTSWWSAVPAALVLVAILAVGWKFLIPGMSNDPLLDLAPPVESTEGFLFIEPKNYAERFAGIDERYQEILVTYAQAIDENWSEEQWQQAGLCPELYSEAAYAGYSLMDLDENGVFELLICAGNAIYEIHAILGGEERQWVSKLLTRTDVRASIQLCEDNIIRAIENGDRFGGTYYTMYRLGNDGLGVLAMVSEEIIFVTAEGDWYAGPYEKDAVPVTEAEATAALKKYVDAVLPVTTFSGAEQQEPGDVVPQGYTHILEKYIQAHKENWTPEACMQNDISYMVASKNIFWEYGYAQIDLNGDGSSELIITDGENIYDAYMLMPDGGAGHIISAGERTRYFLSKDNIIGYHGSSGAGSSSWDFSRLLPGGDSEIVMYLQFDTDTYYKMEGGSDQMVEISHDEADELIAEYWYVEIPFQTILPAEQEMELKYPRTYVQMLRELMGDYSGLATMHVALVDVSGDGEEELLLGLRESFGHVYSIVDGQVEEVLTYGSDIGFTLCENGVICYYEPTKPFGDYTFISMKDNENRIIECMVYDKDNGSWVREKDGVKESISQDEFQAVIDSYGSVKLTMIPVMEFVSG